MSCDCYAKAKDFLDNRVLFLHHATVLVFQYPGLFFCATLAAQPTLLRSESITKYVTFLFSIPQHIILPPQYKSTTVCKMTFTSKLFGILLLASIALRASAFVAPTSTTRSTNVPIFSAEISPTALSERQWNFNEGQSPWGLKKNAEVWNGRVAQMAFVWIFLQELITGKGVIQGIQEGNLFYIVNAGIVGVSVLALTVWLAIKGDNDFTKDV
eukprot:scaffold2563_cov124-Cylindrotheca_fusiformis.AAC.6